MQAQGQMHTPTLSMPATRPNPTPVTRTKAGADQRLLVAPPTLQEARAAGKGSRQVGADAPEC